MAEEKKEEKVQATEPEKEVKVTFTDEEVSDGKGIAWLSYLGILLLIPLLTKKENKFAMAHVRQGLIMLIFFIVISIIFACPVVGWVVGTLAWLAALICDLIALINAITGKYWRIPVLGKLAEKWFANL